MTELHKIIVAGVGGQGVITLAQIILQVARQAGYYVLQSEIHGMGQRGGVVNAHVLFDQQIITGPIIEKGGGSLLIGLEPLEALRYLDLLSPDARLIVSINPLENISNYPDHEDLLNNLKMISNVALIDTRAVSQTLRYRYAGNIVLLGKASLYMPFQLSIWEEKLTELFKHKGETIVQKNLDALRYGRNIK